MREYYLLSLKWSKGDQYIWWGPNNSGYYMDIKKAGIYTEEKLNKNKIYYNNTGVMPVPVEVVNKADCQKVIVANSDNYNLFGIHEHLKNAKEY